MILNLGELNKQAVESTAGSGTKMRLSENASSMVFQLFTKNIYSNPIGTVVREITSNCFDSHTEAGINAPVLIKRGKDNTTGSQYISFIDFGVGMSPDRVMNIYCVYFESTKRVDNNQIGGFGIGAKSVLTYKRSTGLGEGEYDNSFNIITNYNGVRYYYLVFEGTESPVVSLLHEEPTTEHNGTEVRIPILEKDISKFELEMVKQLYYFENIVFEGFDKSVLNNEYEIIQGKNFLYRGTDVSSYMHVCLGRVAYPIDYSILGLDSSAYAIPVALRLNVGDINVTVSREQLDYNENTIKLLKEKLIVVKDEIIEILIKQYENIVTLEEYFNYKTKFGQIVFPNGNTLLVNGVIKEKDVTLKNYKFTNVHIGNDAEMFKIFFTSTLYGKKLPKRSRRYSRGDDGNVFSGSYKEILTATNVYHIDGEFDRKVLKQAYLKSLNDRYYIIKKNDLSKLNMYEINSIFGQDIPIIIENGVALTFTEILESMQEEYFGIITKNTENYDDLIVPDEFIASRKRKKIGISDKETEISVKFINPDRYSDSYKYKVKFTHFCEFKSTIFYGTTKDEYELKRNANIFKILFGTKTGIVTGFSPQTKRNVFGLNQGNADKTGQITGLRGIMFLQISETNAKFFKLLDNAYHIDEFNDKMLKRKKDMVLTHFRTRPIFQKYELLEGLYRNKSFTTISPEWGAKINSVVDYVRFLEKRNTNISEIANYESHLSKYFNIQNNQYNVKEKECFTNIEELLELQSNNESIVKYIRIPSYTENYDTDLWTILGLLMTL